MSLRVLPKVIYFAYGSNMFTARLQHRVPSAVAMGIGELHGYALRWHKCSSDKSGKCDAYATGKKEDVIWGVLYRIDPHEKCRLDEAEGLRHGYDERTLDIHTRDGVFWAYAYVATDLDAKLRPYDWYKAYVVNGARLHGVPSEYIRTLEAIEAIRDPDKAKSDQEWAFIQGGPAPVKLQAK